MSEVWPFAADENLVDSYEFLTDLMRAGSAEKRMVVRRNPQRYISMSHVLTDETYALYKAIAKRISSSGLTLLPLWVDAVRVTDVVIGQTEFFFTTTGFDFSTKAIIWNSSFDFEVLDIATVNSSSIVISNPVTKNRQVAFIVPLRDAFAVDGFSLSRNSFNFHVASQKFKIVDDDQIGESFTGTNHFGVPVIPFRPTRNNSLEERIVDTTSQLENGSGPFTISKILTYTDFMQTVEFRFTDRTTLRLIRDFVCSLKGRSGRFWLPSYFNEITLLSNANSTATVRKVMPSSEYIGKHVYIEMKNGTKYTRKISNANESGGNIVLTFSAALGTSISPANVFQFCFMSLVRSDSDQFEFNYDPGVTATVSFPVMEVPEIL
jgi:hypothetical protein